MKIHVQTAADQWFCLGWFINKNNHPKLPPFCSYPASTKSGHYAHYSMKEALDHCIENPNLSSSLTLLDLDVSYKKPKIKEGFYYGVRWYYLEAFNCYGCELSGSELIPFKSLAQTKRHIKDWYYTVGYAD